MADMQAVVIDFKYGLRDREPLFALERRLNQLLTPQVGEYDGYELTVDLSEGTLFLYGASADALWAAIESSITGTPFMRGAKVTLRYGEPDLETPEAVIALQ